jgi:hypothetical protein
MPNSLPPLPAVTLGTLQGAVLARLGDNGAVYWSGGEVAWAVKEALRYWNAATRFWRTRVQFDTAAGVAFYDLSTAVPSQLGYSVTDADLVSAMEYHLLEPATPAAYSGTSMFTQTDLVGALERRRNQFLAETGAVLTYYTPQVVPTPSGRIALQDSIIDIRRLAWKTPSGYCSPLWRENEWQMTTLMGAWTQTPGKPVTYSVSVTPPFGVQFAPPPSASGTLDALVVNAGAALNPAGPTPIGIPDDFSWVPMWGALADLLGESGPAYDPARAQYCEQRWRDGVEMAKSSATVMQAQINGVPCEVASLFELDGLNPTWENIQGTPSLVAMAGLNMLALSPVPDGVYSITLDVVQNTPIPANTGAQILIGRDAADVIVDYAQHVAAFKQGGEEFAVTSPLYDRVNRLAHFYRQRTGAQTRTYRPMMGLGRKQLSQIPMRATTVQ